MITFRATILACFILLVGEAACPQSLSTLILPSEDELIEALRSGEIDYSQYYILLDIIQHGIDSSESYLLDEIPNISFFPDDSSAGPTVSGDDQTAAFVASQPTKPGGRGRVKYRYLQSLEQNSRAAYRVASTLNFTPGWHGLFQVSREYSGRERWTSRAIQYRSESGFLRRLDLGTFNARLGLGTVFGYRGKLMSYSDRLNGESFLFPDYGGYNGLHAAGRAGGYEIEGLMSAARDDDYLLTSAGGALSYSLGKIKPQVILGINRLSNRNSNVSLWDSKVAAGIAVRNSGGSHQIELSSRADRVSGWAAVAEGKQRLKPIALTYAGWAYADSYRNLTGGGKSALISCRMTFDELQFECSDRRIGQKGGLAKAAVEATRSWVFAGQLLMAVTSRDTVNTELLGSIQHVWTERFVTQLDYLTKRKKRLEAGGIEDLIDRRWRLDTRFQSGNLSLKAYITYTSDADGGNYSALLISARLNIARVGVVELWSNFGRIRSGRIDYWYIFVRQQQELVEGVMMAVKFAHVYQRGSARESQPTLSLELEALL